MSTEVLNNEDAPLKIKILRYNNNPFKNKNWKNIRSKLKNIYSKEKKAIFLCKFIRKTRRKYFGNLNVK